MRTKRRLCLALAWSAFLLKLAVMDGMDRFVIPVGRGAILLADRFCDSTEVYQGAARGLSAEWIRKVCDFVRKGTTPDLTLLLDIEPAAGLARTRSRSQNPENDRFDSENLGFHTAVRNGFLELARREPGRICVIDASADAQTVQQNIREVCRERLGLF